MFGMTILENVDVLRDLVTRANAVGKDSNRPGAPFLSETSTSEEIARWLQWCDQNGCHVAALAKAQGFDPYTIEEAWQALADMLNEGETVDAAGAERAVSL